MKKFILLLLVIITISSAGLPLFAQENELNRVNLSPKESKEYMQKLESTWKKLKKMPRGTTWSFDKIIRTSGKIVKDSIVGYKIYVLTIDRRAYFDNGSIVSSMKFEIYANDLKKQMLFPLETIDFYYSHDLNKGIALYLVKDFYDDSIFHKKSDEEVLIKIREFMKNIDELFL